jgi:hypothetical protein
MAVARAPSSAATEAGLVLRAPAPPAPAPAAANASENNIEEENSGADANDEDTYAEYRAVSILEKFPTAKKHPDPLVESSSLASIALPPLPQNFSLPTRSHQDWIDKQLISDAQLETVIYANLRFDGPRLAEGNKRPGFFLGDGAGVGKGRQIAALIKDFHARGGKRVLWVSVSTDLRQDAARDLKDVGASEINVYPDKVGGNLPPAKKCLDYEGVLFVTYSLLINKLPRANAKNNNNSKAAPPLETLDNGGAAGPSNAATHSNEKKPRGRGHSALFDRIYVPRDCRLSQITRWLKDCPEGGLIILDECHKAKNLLPSSSGEPSQTARAVVELQEAVPNARILYSSATGASEPKNLAYMTRLFDSSQGASEMITLLEGSRLGACELAAMSMKATGSYLSRTLSYKDAEFGLVKAMVTDQMVIMYDRAVMMWDMLWRVVNTVQNMEASNMRLMGLKGKGTGRFLKGQFWGAHQRFFKQMLMAAKIPACSSIALEELSKGNCVVIGLQTTGEAGTEQALKREDEAKQEHQKSLVNNPEAQMDATCSIDDLISAPRAILQQYITGHFPITRFAGDVTLSQQQVKDMAADVFDFVHRMKDWQTAEEIAEDRRNQGNLEGVIMQEALSPETASAEQREAAREQFFVEIRAEETARWHGNRTAGRKPLQDAVHKAQKFVEAKEIRVSDLKKLVEEMPEEEEEEEEEEIKPYKRGRARRALVIVADSEEEESEEVEASEEKFYESEEEEEEIAVSGGSSRQKRKQRGAIVEDSDIEYEPSATIEVEQKDGNDEEKEVENTNMNSPCPRPRKKVKDRGILGDVTADNDDDIIDLTNSVPPKKPKAKTKDMVKAKGKAPAVRPQANKKAPQYTSESEFTMDDDEEEDSPVNSSDDEDMYVAQLAAIAQGMGRRMTRQRTIIVADDDDDRDGDFMWEEDESDDDEQDGGGRGCRSHQQPKGGKGRNSRIPPAVKLEEAKIDLERAKEGLATREAALQHYDHQTQLGPRGGCDAQHAKGSKEASEAAANGGSKHDPLIKNICMQVSSPIRGYKHAVKRVEVEDIDFDEEADLPGDDEYGIVGGLVGDGYEAPPVLNQFQMPSHYERHYNKDLWEIRYVLLRAVSGMELPANPLDHLINLLGGEPNVAELTGRKGFISLDEGGQAGYKKRGGAGPAKEVNLREKEDFMSGRKLVAIISEAASTGISLQADRRVGNQRRRVHITLELPWSADKAIQQFGRSHRANQTSAPIYRILMTPCGGEVRFASAAAKRLASLGALLRGDRHAVGVGSSLQCFDVDSTEGQDALKLVLETIAGNKRTWTLLGVHPPELPSDCQDPTSYSKFRMQSDEDIERRTGTLIPEFFLRMRRQLASIGLLEIKEGMGFGGQLAVQEISAADNVPTVKKFLNRLLGMKISDQELLFTYFGAVLDAVITDKKSKGEYDDGILTVKAQSVKIVSTNTVYRHATGGTIEHIHLKLDRGLPWQAALDFKETIDDRLREVNPGGHIMGGFFKERNRNMLVNGRRIPCIILATEIISTVGSFRNTRVHVQRPNTGAGKSMYADELPSRFVRINNMLEAKALWEAWYNYCEDHCFHGDNCANRHKEGGCNAGGRRDETHIMTGAVLPVWKQLEEAHRMGEWKKTYRRMDRDGYEYTVVEPLRVIKVVTSDGLPVVGVAAVCEAEFKYLVDKLNNPPSELVDGVPQQRFNPAALLPPPLTSNGEASGSSMAAVKPNGKKYKHFR